MKKLISEIKNLQRKNISKVVSGRLNEFKDLGQKGNDLWFSELCFCICTANSKADMGLKIQKALGSKGFLSVPEKKLAVTLKTLGSRFHTRKAHFICLARKNRRIKDILHGFESEQNMRDWIAENIKGIGYKEASHFLRNVGFDNLAIIDRHVLNLLKEYGYIKQIPASMTKKTYEDIEKKLLLLGAELKMKQSELDLYMWFMKTGKVLK